MSETKLKPCPFCGGEAYKRIAFPVDPDGMEMNMYIVGCKTCDIEFSWLWDEECVMELWNNRPIENEIRKKVVDEFVNKIDNVSDFLREPNTISGGYAFVTLENIEKIAEQMKTE